MFYIKIDQFVDGDEPNFDLDLGIDGLQINTFGLFRILRTATGRKLQNGELKKNNEKS
jgi:hypothetical protein